MLHSGPPYERRGCSAAVPHMRGVGAPQRSSMRGEGAPQWSSGHTHAVQESVLLTLPGLVPIDLGAEDQRQHQDADLRRPAAAWALRDPPAVSGLTFYVLPPLTPFSGVVFIFVLFSS